MLRLNNTFVIKQKAKFFENYKNNSFFNRSIQHKVQFVNVRAIYRLQMY